MSREIEFRAWHRKYKYIARVADISFNRGVVNLNGADISKIEEIELMQWTGLKDRNGVKIFEGDIVKCKVCTLDNETYEIDDIGEVVYDDDCCTYLINFNEGCIRLSSAWDLEVIGNIYANKELLEDE